MSAATLEDGLVRTPRILAIPLAIAASLIIAVGAAAGGWATVKLDASSPTPGAGDPTEIGLTVLQHGKTPIDWIGLTVVATNAVTGEAVVATAHPKGPIGHYVATLTFPGAGDWSLSYQSQDLVMEGTATLTVTDAAIAPASTATAAGPAAAAPAVALGLLVLAFLVTAGAIFARDRRQRGRAVTTG